MLCRQRGEVRLVPGIAAARVHVGVLVPKPAVLDASPLCYWLGRCDCFFISDAFMSWPRRVCDPVCAVRSPFVVYSYGPGGRTNKAMKSVVLLCSGSRSRICGATVICCSSVWCLMLHAVQSRL